MISVWKKINGRKKVKKKLIQARSEHLKTTTQELDKEVKKLVMADMKKYTDNIATEAAGRNGIGTLYKTTEQLTRGLTSTDTPVRNQLGQTIISKVEQLMYWKNQFETIHHQKLTVHIKKRN